MPKVPQGFQTLIPQIAVKNGDKAIALYKEALGAKEMRRMLLPGTDKIMHAALEIGSSKLFLSAAVTRLRPLSAGTKSTRPAQRSGARRAISRPTP